MERTQRSHRPEGPWKHRLKRWVAPAHRLVAGNPRDPAGPRPETLKSTVRQVVDLAWPIAAGMLGETAIGLVDTKLAAGLGAAALGGVGIGTTLMYLNYSIVFGLMRGVKVRTAYAVGRGTHGDGGRYAQAGIAMGLVAGIAFWLLGRDIGWVLRLLSVNPVLIEPGRAFFAAVTWGAPATCVLAAMVQYRQALGDARSPMIVGLAGNAINALLAYGLIYGHFGLPALGVQGAGYGTAITEWLEALAMLVLFVREERPRPIVSIQTAFREVASLGLPTGLHFGAEMLAFTAFTAILGTLGEAEIAAHQIALAILRVSFLPGVAVAEAASVLVGQSLGQKDLARAERVTLSALGVAVAFMAACGILFAVLGGGLAWVFAPSAAVATIVRRLLAVAAVFQILDAVNIVLRGALRGAKDVRMVAFLGIAIVWVCVPGAALLFGRHMGLGALGGWLGFVCETTLAAGLFWLRWRRGSWRRDYAEASAPRDEGPPTSTEEFATGSAAAG